MGSASWRVPFAMPSLMETAVPYYLTDAQRNLLAPAVGDHPRDGATVPTTNQTPFVNAACWGWALNGEYVNADDPYAALVAHG